MQPPESFFRKQFFLEDGTPLLESLFSPVPSDCSLVKTHVAGELVLVNGRPYRVIRTQFSIEEGETIILRFLPPKRDTLSPSGY